MAGTCLYKQDLRHHAAMAPSECLPSYMYVLSSHVSGAKGRPHVALYIPGPPWIRQCQPGSLHRKGACAISMKCWVQIRSDACVSHASIKQAFTAASAFTYNHCSTCGLVMSHRNNRYQRGKFTGPEGLYTSAYPAAPSRC